MSVDAQNGCKGTRLAFVWMQIASEPMVALYTLFPFILRKDLHASALQIALFVSIRPVVALLAYYVSHFQLGNHKTLGKSLISTWFLAFIPYLFLPFWGGIGMFFLSAICYQLFSKAAMPPLMEILKQNVPQKPRENLVALTYVMGFLESGLFAVLMFRFSDEGSSNWKFICLGAALFAMSSCFFQKKIPETFLKSIPQKGNNALLDPLKKSFKLMRENPELRHFQLGYMIGGSALMLMAPALVIFYADNLQLSHASISIARFVFMAIGVIFSVHFWKKSLQHISLNRLSAWILLGFCLFPILLFLAYYERSLLYVAFLLYGCAQAGSHLIWNLSSTMFAKDGDSTPFTALNLLFQGIRGVIAPLVGGVLCYFFGPVPIMMIGSFLCLFGMRLMFFYSRKEPIFSQ